MNKLPTIDEKFDIIIDKLSALEDFLEELSMLKEALEPIPIWIVCLVQTLAALAGVAIFWIMWKLGWV